MSSKPVTTCIDDLLKRNLDAVNRRISAACHRSCRETADVRLVAVTKSVGEGIIQRLTRIGAEHLGENRIADAESRIRAVPSGPTWHFIGHLQGNKARRAVRLFSWIHSVDSVALLERIDRIAGEEGRRTTVLLQVNVSEESTKHGAPETALATLVERAARAANLEVAGLMTMAPLSEDQESARPVFRRLAELLVEQQARGVLDERFRDLSMGMTDDFEIAIEEGATLVRVGRALFEGLEPGPPGKGNP